MKEGKIAEIGTYDELLKNDGASKSTHASRHSGRSLVLGAKSRINTDVPEVDTAATEQQFVVV